MAMAMACWINTQAVATKPKPQTQACSSLSPSEKCAKLFASQLSSTSSISSLSICSNQILIRLQKAPSFAIYPKQQVMAFAGKQRPVKIMISGAPASGKGTQCELITNKVTFTCLLSLSHSIFIVCVPVVIFVNPRTRGPARLENCLLICYASIDISIP